MELGWLPCKQKLKSKEEWGSSEENTADAFWIGKFLSTSILAAIASGTMLPWDVMVEKRKEAGNRHLSKKRVQHASGTVTLRHAEKFEQQEWANVTKVVAWSTTLIWRSKSTTGRTSEERHRTQRKPSLATNVFKSPSQKKKGAKWLIYRMRRRRVRLKKLDLCVGQTVS